MVVKLGRHLYAHAGTMVLLVLAACAPEPERQSEAIEPAAAPAAPQASASAKSVPSAPLPDLAMDGGGLRLIEGKSDRLLPFGMRRDALLAVLEPFRGRADSGTNSECGAGPLDYAVWADGLTLYFQDGSFAGWALDERAEGAHATASGIGPGSTRRALDSLNGAEVEQSTLGTEFRAGGLSGILDGPGPEARVTALWAGMSCVFR